MRRARSDPFELEIANEARRSSRGGPFSCAVPPAPCRETGGFDRPAVRQWGQNRISGNLPRNPAMSAADTPRLPATFNRLAWSNLAAQSAEQIALAAAPIVAVLLLGVGEGQTGLLQTALTLPFILFAIPGRSPRRPHLAALGDGRLRSAAGRGAGRHSAADLAGADDAAAALAARLHRGVRNGRLQRRRTRFGAVAGDVATTARGQCADRTGAHGGVRQRSGARRRAGRMGRRRARLRLCRGVVRDRSRAAVGHL